jgi:hypothetical protein
MDPFVSKKVKHLLITIHGINIYDIIGAYMGFNKSYDAYIYFQTDAELHAMTVDKKEEIQAIYIDYLKKHGYMPNEIERVRFYFDSDENVQKNYGGNYFYATR